MELAWLLEHLGAKLKLKPSEPMGPGSQYSYFRATRTRVDVDTIHIASRETYIKNVLDILGLGANKCKSMPTPTVQARQKSDEDEPRLGEEDRRTYHRCVGILRHLLKCAQTSLLQSVRLTRRSHRPETQTSGDCEDLADISWAHKSLAS